MRFFLPDYLECDDPHGYIERMVIKVKPPAFTGGWLLNKHDFEKLIIVLAWA